VTIGDFRQLVVMISRTKLTFLVNRMFYWRLIPGQPPSISVTLRITCIIKGSIDYQESLGDHRVAEPVSAMRCPRNMMAHVTLRHFTVKCILNLCDI
jgi:hypothetical protein